MNKDLEKFRKLLLTDEEFQQKLKAAAQAYNGEKSEDAVFSAVLVPIAAEYGITATFDEFRSYIYNLSDQELNADEIGQIAGGGDKGFGVSACYVIGAGYGSVNPNNGKDDPGSVCWMIGVGHNALACAGEGVHE